jgi:hypothetical protein
MSERSRWSSKRASTRVARLLRSPSAARYAHTHAVKTKRLLLASPGGHGARQALRHARERRPVCAQHTRFPAELRRSNAAVCRCRSFSCALTMSDQPTHQQETAMQQEAAFPYRSLPENSAEHPTQADSKALGRQPSVRVSPLSAAPAAAAYATRTEAAARRKRRSQEKRAPGGEMMRRALPSPIP